MQANVQDVNFQISKENQEGLDPEMLPKTPTQRIMGVLSYFAMILGGCIAIGTFTLGATVFGVINLKQAIAAVIIGNLVIVLGMSLNGRAGHLQGIPMTIQLRTSFGILGSKIPGILRAAPAIVWFGFQSWIGGGAINLILNTMFGFDNIVLCFIVFHIIQVVLAFRGFKSIKWLENVGAIFILITLAYMAYTSVSRFGVEISESIINIEGSWGLPFWSGVAVFLGNYATNMVNVSDLSRNLDVSVSQTSRTTIYLLAILPATMAMILIGLIVAGATGVHDPITIFSATVENPVLLVATLLFIVFSQLTTNVLNNLVPPAYVIMDLFKTTFLKAVIIVGVGAVAVFPWKLVTDESAAGLALFIHIYSAFLGPIFAVMLTDYYVIRKQKLPLEDMYDKEGPFSQINWSGIIAIIVGALTAIIWVDIGWFVSLIPSSLTYYLLSTKTNLSTDFLVGTKYEKNKCK